MFSTPCYFHEPFKCGAYSISGCTNGTEWRHPTRENCKVTFSHWRCMRARWKQQEAAKEVGEIKTFSSQRWVFLACFCLQDLGQACLSLIITQVLFSLKCVFYFYWESLVNRSGGVRRQVNRGRVFHRAWRRVFLACHRPAWMDNWALCDPSWQRRGLERRTTGRNHLCLSGSHPSSIASTSFFVDLFSGNFQMA